MNSAPRCARVSAGFLGRQFTSFFNAFMLSNDIDIESAKRFLASVVLSTAVVLGSGYTRYEEEKV